MSGLADDLLEWKKDAVKQCFRCKKFKFKSQLVQASCEDGNGKVIFACWGCFKYSQREARIEIAESYEVDEKTCSEIRKSFQNTWYNSFGSKTKEHTITFEDAVRIWARQKGICALSGRKMSFRKNVYSKASIDRIDSKKGYDPDNVQWVCWAANMMKNDMTLPELRFWTKAISDHLTKK